MAISNEFKEACDKGDKIMVRIMLKNIMLVDPSLAEFQEMLDYAEKTMPDLYDEHDGEELLYNIKQWTTDYMNEQMVVVVNNFSKERVKLLKLIVKYLYGDKPQNTETKKTYSDEKHITQKQVGVGLTAAGVITAGLGVYLSEGIVIAGGVAVAAAGVFLIATDKGDE